MGVSHFAPHGFLAIPGISMLYPPIKNLVHCQNESITSFKSPRVDELIVCMHCMPVSKALTQTFLGFRRAIFEQR